MFICLIIDQVIKNILINVLLVGDSIKIIGDFFKITLVLNDGAAFSILSNHVLFLIILSLLVLFILGYYLFKNKNLKNIEYIFYGILSGGIIGNLIDRIINGSVIDYLDFNIFGYNFPIFNFADICIVLSMMMLIIIYKDGKDGV